MGVLTGVLFLIIGGAMMLYAVYLAGRRHHGADSDAALREAQSIVEDARSKGALIVREAELKAKDLLVEVRAQAEREVRDQHRELTALESKLVAREESIDKRLEAFERREGDLNRRDQNLRTKEKSLADRESRAPGTYRGGAGQARSGSGPDPRGGSPPGGRRDDRASAP